MTRTYAFECIGYVGHCIGADCQACDLLQEWMESIEADMEALALDPALASLDALELAAQAA